MIEAPPGAAPVAELPDEERLALPAAWKRHVRPRRGAAEPSKIALNPDRKRKELAKVEQWARKSLDLEANAEYRPHVLAFLDGEPDALGAAVTGLLLDQVRGKRRARPRPMFDLVAADHGLPAAVCATVELMSLRIADTAGEPYRRGLVRELGFGDIDWEWVEAREALEDIRALLAAASEEDYAAVVAALGRHRGAPVKRLVTSMLLPWERAWLDEVCADHRNAPSDPFVSRLLVQLVETPEQIRAAGGLRGVHFDVTTAEVADLLFRLGVHAFPLLADRLGSYLSGAAEKVLLKAIAMLPSDEATALLLDRLDRPQVMACALGAAARFPRRVLRLVARSAAGAERERRERLAAVLRADPIILETALPAMDREVREAIEPLVETKERVPAASRAALPALLVEPPWKNKGRKRRTVVLEGLVPPRTRRVLWAEGERDSVGPLDGEENEPHWRHRVRQFGARGFDYTFFFSSAPLAMAEAHLDRWDGEGTRPTAHELERILARFGERAADRVTRLIAGHPGTRGALGPILSLEAARLAADWLVRSKSSRAVATAWLERHAEEAAVLLVPDALGKAGKPRAAAEAALRHLILKRGPEPVLAAAERYGAEAAAAIGELAGADPLEAIGGKIPETGTLFAAAMFPQVLLKGREEALPREAVEHLVTVLALASPDYRYGGIDVIAEHCDGESLARFSWAVFEHWLRLGAPPAHGWALTQLAHFADDDTVRGLTERLCEWPGMNQHKRAIAGLEVLGAIGTEAALRAIHGISEKVRFEALRFEARTQIKVIAETLGLSTDQLADRLVPDFGIGEDATLLYDYGPRRFTVGFDERLKPFVTDEGGKRLKTLPKPGVRDDEALASASRQRFARLRKEMRTVATDQVKRMERAMLEGRTWSAEEFAEYFVDHALVRRLTGRLIWLADFGGKRVAFRLAEDRSLADADEEEFDLPGEAVIRLAHPVLLGDRVGRWSEILADYEILQPFEQLARPAMAFTEEEVATGRLARFEGRRASTGALLGLTRQGWDRGSPGTGGMETVMEYRLPGARVLTISLDPGIFAGHVNHDLMQTLREVRLCGGVGERLPEEPREQGLGALDPVLASELLAGLAKATRTS